MSQVYSIIVSEDQSEFALSRFLDEWLDVGSYERSENGYLLTAHTGEKGLVTLEDREILFQGQFSDDGLDRILTLAEVMETELLLEGEPLESNASQPKWRDFGWLGKTSGALLVPLALLAVLLFVLALPVLLIVMLVRIVFGLQKKGL